MDREAEPAGESVERRLSGPLDPLLETIMARRAARHPPLAKPEHPRVAAMRIEVINKHRRRHRTLKLAICAQRIGREVRRSRRLPPSIIATGRRAPPCALIGLAAGLGRRAKGARLAWHVHDARRAAKPKPAARREVKERCLKGSLNNPRSHATAQHTHE